MTVQEINELCQQHAAAQRDIDRIERARQQLSEGVRRTSITIRSTSNLEVEIESPLVAEVLDRQVQILRDQVSHIENQLNVSTNSEGEANGPTPDN
jgi:hypothetical protein